MRIILSLLPFALPLYVLRFHIGPLPTTALEIVILAALAVWTWQRGIDGWRSAHREIHARGFAWPIGLWLLAGLVGVAVAADHVGALGLWRAYFLEPILVFAMLTDLVRKDEDKRALLRSLALVSIGVAAWAIAQYAGLLPIPSPWHAPPTGIRATGPFPYPNALALFVVPIAALCFQQVTQLTRSRQFRALLFLGFLSGLASVILAKSDGGLVALTAAAFVTLVLKKSTRFPTIAIAAVSIAAALIVPMSRDVIYKQVFFKEWSGKVRLVMWEETRNMLADHPVTGVGLGGYPDGIKPYHKATWMEIFQYPHNILLNLWSEVGLLGIAAFGWILFAWIKSSEFRVPSSESGYSLLATRYSLPIIVALLVHGLVDVPYFKNDLAVMFWMLIALSHAHEDGKKYPRQS